METRTAVFLDRDGVINKEHGYVHTIDDFHFIDGVFDACREMSQAGYRLMVFTIVRIILFMEWGTIVAIVTAANRRPG